MRLRALLLGAAAAAALRLPAPVEPRQPDLSVIHVTYVADPGAFTGLLSSMLSLSRSLKRPQDCRIHLIVAEEDTSQAESLSECFRRELVGLEAIPVVEVHGMRAEAMPFDASKSVGDPHLKSVKASFFRFYIADLLPAVDRVLYLDTDTIVRTDVGPLYRMPMRHSIAIRHERARMEKLLLLPTVDMNGTNLLRYMPDKTLQMLQSGVVLMDLRKWRSEGIARALEKWPERLGTYNDQIIISLEYNYRREHDTLDEAWNLYGMGLRNWFERLVTATPNWTPAQLAEARIFHFSGFGKPWRNATSKEGTAPKFQELYTPYAPHLHCEALGGQGL